jgi:hypothetical protein
VRFLLRAVGYFDGMARQGSPDERSEADATPVPVPPLEEAPSATGVVLEEDEEEGGQRS